MKKSYWQDWVTLILTALVLLVVLMATGCGSAPQPVRNYPVVLVFTAAWCPNCPNAVELDELAEDFPGVMILPVDIDENHILATKYGVKRVPQYFLCTDETCSSTASMAELRSWLARL